MATARKQSTELAPIRREFQSELSKLLPQIRSLLPHHISPERFARNIVTAVDKTPALYAVEWDSLRTACLMAAEDALVPDGREGAIVPFKDTKNQRTLAVWIPMVAGIRKLVRQSGLIRDLHCEIVYEGEPFEHEEGDRFFVRHKKMPFDGDPAKRPVVCVYETAVDNKGFNLHHELMWENELLAIGRRSKAFGSGPWSDPLFALEMRRKTCTKRHFKQLPTSRDLDRVLGRDNELYQFEDERRARREEVTTIRGGAAAALADFGKPDHAGRVGHERQGTSYDRDVPEHERQGRDGPPHQSEGAPEPEETKTESGTAAEVSNDSADSKTADEYATRFRAYLAGATTGEAIDAKWKRERDLRNKLNMPPEVRNDLDTARGRRVAELRQPGAH